MRRADPEVGGAKAKAAKESGEPSSRQRDFSARSRGRLEWSREEVRARVDELNTPFLRRADALMRKNMAFQATRRVCTMRVQLVKRGRTMSCVSVCLHSSFIELLSVQQCQAPWC